MRARSVRSESRMRSGRRIRSAEEASGPRDTVRRRLEDVYRIGRRLALGGGREQAITDVLSVIGETVHLRSAILVDHIEPYPRTTAWISGPPEVAALDRLCDLARAAYAEIVGEASPALGGPVATHAFPPSTHSPQHEWPSLLVLPLVTGAVGPFGVLQLEAFGSIDESDLAFVHACGGQLAHALVTPTLPRKGPTPEALRYRDELLSLVSHDLKGPLGAILITTDSLLVGADDAHGRALALIRRAGMRMMHLVKDLLDVASIDARHLSVEHRDVSIAAVIDEAVEAVRPAAAAKRIEIELDVQADLPEVLGDRDRLNQILANLLGNALKFTREGGVVSVSAARDGDFARLSITDTGCGIADESLAHVFERFWQAPENFHRGTGLGLYIVKSLVEAQGGTVTVRSALGVGTTFSFTMPIRNG